MNRIGLAAALSCIGMAAFAGVQAKVESVTTPGGHQFVFSPVRNTTRVAFQVAWPSNWLKEEGRNPALPHLGAALMTRGGAGDMDASELLENFLDIDATAAVWATPDHVRAKLDVSIEHLDEALEIALAVLARPRFDDRWLNRIRDGMHGRWKQERTQVANWTWNAVRRAVLGSRTLTAALSYNDIDALQRVTRDDLLAWHARTFGARGARITVAGNIPRFEAVAAVDRVLGALREGSTEPAVAVEADFSPRTILVHVPDAEKTMIGFVGRLPSLVHGGENEDVIAVEVLGSGLTSRIFEAIRTKLRASYAPGATVASYTRDIRLFGMWGEVEADKLTRSRETMLDAYRTFREEGPTVRELDSAKARIRRNMRANLKMPATVAHVLMELALDGLEVQSADDLLRELDATSAESVANRLRQAFPTPEELIQVIVTANRDAVDGACVVRTIEEVDGCPAAG